jgi:DNA repair exonuclease SbcCD nuclease subunit
MKILFTADWHIKLGQKNVPIDWQIDRYELLITKLNVVKADLMIVGGDIFDRVPSIDELNLYFSMVSRFNKTTFIYSGNHEAVGKTTTFLTKLKDVTKAVNSKVYIVDNYTCYNNGEYEILPYNHLKTFAATPQEYEQHAPILFTHVRGEIPPHVTPEVPLQLFDKWSTVFAGDLHSHSNSQRNIVYPGSPLTISFHRNEVDTGYILIDTETQEWKWHKLELPQLLRKTITDPKLMISDGFNHTIYEIEGDINELAKVESHDLLDKKVISTTSESRLNLTKDMSVTEELHMFLKEILKLKDEDITDILDTYHAYIS